jgi:hypothetical protein
LSIDTTTGMSAPPMAITMCTPNSSAITVITSSGSMPDLDVVRACRNSRPNQTTTSRPARFIQCRPGSSSGLPPILPDSLPNAITEPENVTAPIRMPM